MTLNDLQLYRKAYNHYLEVTKDNPPITFHQFTERFTLREIEQILADIDKWIEIIVLGGVEMTAVISGAVPFDHWRERETIIGELKKEFDNQILIKHDDNLIFYTHYCTL